MSDISPFSATRDDELGSAVRAALEPMHHEAFVARVRARIGQSGRAWEDELAGWGWSRPATNTTVEASVASELLDGKQPGADILLVAMTSGDR